MWSWSKTNALLAVAFLVAGVFALLPIWSVHYLPLLDYPQHLSLVHIFANFDDPAFRYSEYLEQRSWFTTYVTYYLGASTLAQFMSVEAASKVILSLYVLGLPLSLMAALRAFGRSPWIGLLGFPFVFSYPFYMGFMGYCTGLPVLFLGIALWEWALQSPTRNRLILVAIHGPFLFFTHAMVFLLGIGVFGLLIVCHCWSKPGRLFKRLALLLPGLIIVALWIPQLGRAVDDPTVVAQETHAGGFLGAQFPSLHEKINNVSGYLLSNFPGGTDELVSILWIVLVLGFLLLGRRGSKPQDNDTPQRDWLHRKRTGVIVLALFCVYFAAPNYALDIWAISNRLPIVCALAFILVLDVPWRTGWRNLVFIPVLALCCFQALHVKNQFENFQEEVGGLEEVLEPLDDGAKVYSLIFDSHSRSVEVPAFLHFAAYYMLEHGGMISYSFARINSVSLDYRNYAEFPLPGYRAEWEPQRFRYSLYGDQYDYFLVRDSTSRGLRWVREARDQVELVAQARPWYVYRNVGSNETRYDVLWIFRNHIEEAQVSIETPDGVRMPCDEWVENRWRCPQEEWITVGEAQPNIGRLATPCIWAHPHTDHRLLITFNDVPLGNALTGFVAMADSGLENPEGQPVTLNVSLQDQHLGELTRGNQADLEMFEFDTSAFGAETGSFTFTVSTPHDGMRHFCFDVQTVNTDE